MRGVELRMDKSEPSYNWRLWLALLANIAIVALHLPAIARARASHTYFWYGHPWHDTTVDLFIFIFLAVAFVSAIPVVLLGQSLQRCLAAGTLVWPLYVVVTFFLWSLRLYGN
jgi:hypothetical protein